MKRQASQPRSRSEGMRIVSGRGDFNFPAWKPHDDKPQEEKLCLRIRYHLKQNGRASGAKKCISDCTGVQMRADYLPPPLARMLSRHQAFNPIPFHY